MTTITIPKKFTQGKELVVVPKKDWENLLKLARKRISQLEIAKGVKQALDEVKKGQIIGPFTSGKNVIKSLENRNTNK